MSRFEHKINCCLQNNFEMLKSLQEVNVISILSILHVQCYLLKFKFKPLSCHWSLLDSNYGIIFKTFLWYEVGIYQSS